MINRIQIRRLFTTGGAFLLALAVTSTLMACPSCKEALAASDPERANLVRGFFWSILFMLSMPFTLLTGFCTYAYLLVRRAKREQAAAIASQRANQDTVVIDQDERNPVEVG